MLTVDQQNANESISASTIVYEEDETNFTIDGIVNKKWTWSNNQHHLKLSC